ncbi:ABC transporter substrate-binding protein [Poseidonocella sp. HB161398]|uniref:ABC transporter substrate-binding protein n=1 Tax=Poseidonocella sp. HB161398 TaxID=2320855 RepID=UPI0011089456|nr:ABC transporter substrate-binding protein [Poseidonocella sp. HB161398]
MTRLPMPRRLAAAAILLWAALAAAAAAREITDATGRSVTVPDSPARVFAAGPPAAVLLYVLKPEAMLGWTRAPKPADLPYLLPATRGLPALGRLTGRGDTLNLEVLLSAGPDLIVDFGTVNDTYLSLAERIEAQTGVPYVLIDGSFANTPRALRELGALLGVPERGERLARYAEETFAAVDAQLAELPAADRPGVYLARGPEGLETAGPNSINAEIIARAGGRNVVEAENDGLAAISPENVLAWAPGAIVTIDKGFAAGVAADPAWAAVPAVAEGRVYLAPAAPFGFIDSPPSVNRLIGLRWLAAMLHGGSAPGALREEIRDFYTLFYQVTPDDAALDALLGG